MIAMARRPELFVRELSDWEAAHFLKLARRSRCPTVQHRAMLLFASFQGQSVLIDTAGVTGVYREPSLLRAGLPPSAPIWIAEDAASSKREVAIGGSNR